MSTSSYQVSSKSIKQFWRRSRKCEQVYAGRTDGRTDDGRCIMTIAHSSLRLRWAKNQALMGLVALHDIDLFSPIAMPRQFTVAEIVNDVKLAEGHTAWCQALSFHSPHTVNQWIFKDLSRDALIRDMDHPSWFFKRLDPWNASWVLITTWGWPLRVKRLHV